MSPPRRRPLDENGGELAHPALASEDFGEAALAHPDELGEPGLGEPRVLHPPAKTSDGPALCGTIHDSVIDMTRAGVKVIHATPGTVTARLERAARRYMQLVEELSYEVEGRKHGWQTRVARQLGITQSYISKLTKEWDESDGESEKERAPGPDVVDRAIAKMRLKYEYFYGAIEPRSYHDYVSGANEPIYEGWRVFRAGLGASITEEERMSLCSIVLPEGYEPKPAFYEYMLLNLRNQITKIEMERGLQKANELDEKLARRKRPKG